MQGLGLLLQTKHEELKMKAYSAGTWVQKLIDSMDVLPRLLKIKLGPLKLSEYEPSEDLDYILPGTGDDEEANTKIMSLLYSYVNHFLMENLFPKIEREQGFNPAQLEKQVARAVRILEDIQTMTHRIYTAEPVVRAHSSLMRTRVEYPVSETTWQIASFLKSYRAVEIFRYISSYKNALDSFITEDGGKMPDSDAVSSTSKKFKPDRASLEAFILPNIGKSREELESMLRKDLEESAKKVLNTFKEACSNQIKNYCRHEKASHHIGSFNAERDAINPC